MKKRSYFVFFRISSTFFQMKKDKNNEGAERVQYSY
jgi:hypothetical protein